MILFIDAKNRIHCIEPTSRETNRHLTTVTTAIWTLHAHIHSRSYVQKCMRMYCAYHCFLFLSINCSAFQIKKSNKQLCWNFASHRYFVWVSNFPKSSIVICHHLIFPSLFFPQFRQTFCANFQRHPQIRRLNWHLSMNRMACEILYWIVQKIGKSPATMWFENVN